MSTRTASDLTLARAFRPEYLAYHGVLPLEVANERLRVAVDAATALDPEVIEDLKHSFGLDLDLVPTDRAELDEAIRTTFAAEESVDGLVRQLGAGSTDQPIATDDRIADARDLANQPPVVRLVNLLVREANDIGASDIHLDATSDGLRVRVRVDGVLAAFPSPPRNLEAAVVSRLKLLAELDIAERRIPQDGRFRIRLESRDLDLRVATAPTHYGESLVLRLLDRGGRPVELSDLGMDAKTLEAMTQLSRRSSGIVLATGPTGSGKTTTLYAALGLRRVAEEKIITVEDPVEYLLPGVTQVPIHSKAGVTFAAALRSLLRQDPDVIMVGEMRDRETASIATQAALTGHLVFSTLHTNDAASAITRLSDLGVERFLLAATLQGILAQRLVRRICLDCRVEYRPDPQVVSLLTRRIGERTEVHRGLGCPACRNTGYRGRVGLFELLHLTEPLKELVGRGADAGALQRAATEEGMRTMRDDGWAKVQDGSTTIEEVIRVLGI